MASEQEVKTTAKDLEKILMKTIKRVETKDLSPGHAGAIANCAKEIISLNKLQFEANKYFHEKETEEGVAKAPEFLSDGIVEIEFKDPEQEH